jgi:6-phosphogluconolactonase/glucosamine-6-phosphate isomerase/deaminase
VTLRVEVIPAARWAEQVAGEWADRLVTNPRLRMCLASGRTPGPVYQSLVSGGASLADSEVLLLDEFIGLPTGHPGRCESMLRRQLIDLVAVGRFHRIDVDADDLDAEGSRIDELIAQGGIDLAVLGLGLNGHLGMNEPRSEPHESTRVVELAPETIDGLRRYGIGASLNRGLTVGMAQLLAASEVWLLVTGDRKRGILQTVLEGPVGPECPASYLREHRNAVIWADHAAAGTR